MALERGLGKGLGALLEHIDILNAILERRPEDACRLLSEHIQLSYQEAINTMIHCSF